MEVNIKQWNKYKNRIAFELYNEPFDWLDRLDQLDVIHIFKNRLKDNSI